MKNFLPKIRHIRLISPIRLIGWLFFWKKFSPARKKYFELSLGALLIVLIPVALGIHSQATKASAVWFDDNFAYRQIVALTNAGTALTDYPVSITLDSATLITSGKIL